MDKSEQGMENTTAAADSGKNSTGARAVSVLIITNTVTGAYGDRAKVFVFSVFFADKNGAKLAADTEFRYTLSDRNFDKPETGRLRLDNNGKVVFDLIHGQSLTIRDVPLDYMIKIVEDEPNNYKVSFVDSSNNDTTENGRDTGGQNGEMRQMRLNQSFHFYNERIGSGSGGSGLNNVDFIFLLAAAAMIAGIVILIFRAVLRRRKDNEQRVAAMVETTQTTRC